MKLKGLANRPYNIFFHLHTVSGIVLAVALFVIFFAGAFTLFKSEFYLWENPVARKTDIQEFTLARAIHALKNAETEFDMNDETFISVPTEESPVVQIYAHIQPEKEGGAEIHYAGKMDPVSLKIMEKPRSTVGETLYKLHFFDQVPYAGRWIAGFVSLFFIFATITGVLVHWKNMLTKFWAYGFTGTWKQIWTNGHTVFGLLGLPYQLMYAVTGAFYLLLVLVLMPTVMLLYGGSPENVFRLAYPMYNIEYSDHAAAADYTGNIEKISEEWEARYGRDYRLVGVQANHLLKEDAGMTFRMVSKDPEVFFSNAYVGYRLKDGQEVFHSLPGNKKFTYKVIESIMHLHFASFGGLFVKAVYFVMALFSCFVFVSGILIWKEARNNSRYTTSQKQFHRRVTKVFLAICFTLFPATALLFSAELLVPEIENHAYWVNTVFFISWLMMTLFALLLESEKSITRFSLWMGGFFSLLVPLVNGYSTGDWLWKTAHTQVWATDLFWLVTGILSFSIFGFTRPVRPAEAKVFRIGRASMKVTKKPGRRAKVISEPSSGDSVVS